MKENLALLFDQFAERIGHACYAELVRARLPLRLGEARRRVEELEYDAELLGKMQAELLRRESTLSPETAMSRVSAVEFQAPHVRQPKTWLFVDAEWEDEFAATLEAKSVDSGENLVVLIPAYLRRGAWYSCPQGAAPGWLVWAFGPRRQGHKGHDTP